MHDIQIIIMAGGVGSRFWPMSTPDYSKQFIDVMGGSFPHPIFNLKSK